MIMMGLNFLKLSARKNIDSDVNMNNIGVRKNKYLNANSSTKYDKTKKLEVNIIKNNQATSFLFDKKNPIIDKKKNG